MVIIAFKRALCFIPADRLRLRQREIFVALRETTKSLSRLTVFATLRRLATLSRKRERGSRGTFSATRGGAKADLAMVCSIRRLGASS